MTEQRRRNEVIRYVISLPLVAFGAEFLPGNARRSREAYRPFLGDPNHGDALTTTKEKLPSSSKICEKLSSVIRFVLDATDLSGHY